MKKKKKLSYIFIIPSLVKQQITKQALLLRQLWDSKLQEYQFLHENSIVNKSGSIYQFLCKYLANYTGRMKRQLGTKVMKHIPVWVERELKGYNSQH